MDILLCRVSRRRIALAACKTLLTPPVSSSLQHRVCRDLETTYKRRHFAKTHVEAAFCTSPASAVAPSRREHLYFIVALPTRVTKTMAEASQSDEKLDLKVRDGNGAVTHFKVKKSTKFRKILTAYASNDAGIAGTPARPALIRTRSA